MWFYVVYVFRILSHILFIVVTLLLVAVSLIFILKDLKLIKLLLIIIKVHLLLSIVQKIYLFVIYFNNWNNAKLNVWIKSKIANSDGNEKRNVRNQTANTPNEKTTVVIFCTLQNIFLSTKWLNEPGFIASNIVNLWLSHQIPLFANKANIYDRWKCQR